MTNPFRRRAWRPTYQLEPGAQSVAFWAMMTHHLIVAGSGLVGFLFSPSPSVTKVFGGEAATYIWSSAFVVLGALGAVARWLRAVASELWILGGLVATRFIFVVFIIAGLFVDRPPTGGGPANYGALQTAGVLLAGTFVLIALLAWMWAWMSTGRVAPADRVTQVVEVNRIVKQVIADGGLDRAEEH